jgi:phospholipase C
LPVLHTLARHFLVCDHWFSSVPGPTWPNRFFVHSGTSLGHVDMPNGFFHPAIHLYNQPTVYQRLSERGITWNIYYGDFPHSLLLVQQLKYPTHYHHLDDFFEHTAGLAADFPQYTFIEPYYFGAAENDQHPPTDIRHGEALLGSIYNAIRQNDDLWRSTLLVVVYDEHGGFYDHVEPPEAVPPDDKTQNFGFDRLGVRVPALLVSPWVDPGVLDLQFDHTSLLKYATEKWGLGPLGARVASPETNSFGPALTRRSTARDDCPTALSLPEPIANLTDAALNTHQAALAGFSHYLEVNISNADDATVARHSRAMAGTYQSLSETVAERARQFLSK